MVEGGEVNVHPSCTIDLLTAAMEEKLPVDIIKCYNAGYCKQVYENAMLCRDTRLVQEIKSGVKVSVDAFITCDV